MLTGDKMETAENIAISCKLLTPDMKRLYINKKSMQDLILLENNDNIVTKLGLGMLIDGESLGIIL